MQRLQRLWAGPRFADEETSRIAGVLNRVLLVLGGVIAVAAVLAALEPEAIWTRLTPYIIMEVICIALWGVMRAGWVRSAAGVLIASLWLTINISIAISGNLYSPVVFTNLLVVVIAGVLLGSRAVVVTSFASMAVASSLLVGHQRGWVPPQLDRDTPGFAFLVHTINLTTVTYFLYLAVRSLHQALGRTRATEVRAAELLRETQAAKNYADNIINAMAEALVVLNENGAIASVNGATLDLLGYEEEELLEQPFTSLLPDTGKHPREVFAEFLQADNRHREYELRAADGEVIPVLFSSTVMRGRNGEIIGVVCVATDITHRKHAEATLLAAKELAERANVAKSQFLANMSHELRTPLNAVLGYSELLMDEARERGLPELTPELRKIQFAGKHLLGLISDILDLSEIESGRRELNLETFHLPEMLDNIVGTIRPLVEKNGNTLDVRIRRDVEYIHADETKLRQILLNLLGNATKFTRDGTITMAAHCEESPEGPWLSLIVADTGIGMTPEQRDRVFQAYSQAGADTELKFGGTGLGLTISQMFTNLMGGTIELETAPNTGSRFTVRIPYVDPENISQVLRERAFPSGLARALAASRPSGPHASASIDIPLSNFNNS